MDESNKNDQLMKISEKDLDLIQRQLANDHTEATKMEFEAKLGDNDFKEELLYQAKMVDALIEADYLTVREELVNSINSGATKESQVVSRPNQSKKWLWLSMAAILSVIAYLGYNAGKADKHKPVQYAELAETYNIPYPVARVERGNSGGMEERFAAAQKDYANEEWGSALSKFESLTPKTDEINIYEANCHIQLGSYKRALAILSAISTSDTEIAQNVDWYTVISHLGNNDVASAKSVLSRIQANSNHLFYGQAKKLVAALK